MVRWCKPRQPWRRIIVDPAALSDVAIRGIGMVGRDNDGSIFLTMARRFDGRFSVEIAEALTIIYAVREASSRGLSSVEFESDAQRVVNLINLEEVLFNELDSIIESIRFENRGKNFVFLFFSRSRNTVTHKIAKFALSIANLKI